MQLISNSLNHNCPNNFIQQKNSKTIFLYSQNTNGTKELFYEDKVS